MKKIVLLASIVALTALMLAAAPAFAQGGPPGNPENPVPCSVGNPDKFFCDKDKDKDKDNDDNDDNDNNDNNENNGDQKIRLNNVGNLDVSPTFEASQETEQDCDAGESSQNFDVTGGG